jgi:hypothetical protein
VKTVYRHKEAFCLMQYACKACGFREVIWNSRDGVTPFGVQCRQCKSLENHVNWNQDRCVPDYIPTPGQRIFVDLTIELARAMVTDLLRKYVGTKPYGRDIPPEGTPTWDAKVEAIAKEWYRDGHQPHVTEAD